MNGRIYSPKLGRMLSPDPVTQAPENGQNYNRYTYAFNNPLRYTDPSGYKNDDKKPNCVGDSCIQAGEYTADVVAAELNPDIAAGSGSGVVGNQAALIFGVGPGAQAAMNQNMNEQFLDGVEATALENDMQNSAIVGVSADGDLIDSQGNAISQFDYFVGNYDEWGAMLPMFGPMFADIRAVGFEATGILGLVGYVGEIGLYYDTETGEVGIFYSNGGGVNGVDGGIVAGVEGSFSATFTNAPDMGSFSGEGVVAPGGHFGVVGYSHNFPNSGGNYGTWQIGPGGGTSVVQTNTDTISLF